MDLNLALSLLDNILGINKLSIVEELVFSECWHGKTYREISVEHGYEATYLRAVGSTLWRKLSKAFCEDVHKHNLQSIFAQYQQTQLFSAREENKIDLMDLSGPLAPDALVYIHRESLERTCYQVITQPGQLLRIRGPKQSGKTSLLIQVLQQVSDTNHTTCVVDCRLADSVVMSSLKSFLQWFCLSVGRSLGLENRLDKYWEDLCGSSSATTDYFGLYLLAEIQSPLILAIDNADIIFKYSKISQDFFGLLRSWYERSRYGIQANYIWRRLRLILSHSTNTYIPLNINQSPFNVGKLVEIPPFSLDETLQLTKCYELSFKQDDIQAINRWLGGKPYLLQLTLRHLKLSNLSWDIFYSKLDSIQLVYGKHLSDILKLLRLNPNLAQIFSNIILSNGVYDINSNQVFQLYSLGLVIFEKNKAIPSCQLYVHYFSKELKHQEVL